MNKKLPNASSGTFPLDAGKCVGSMQGTLSRHNCIYTNARKYAAASHLHEAGTKGFIIFLIQLISYIHGPPYIALWTHKALTTVLGSVPFLYPSSIHRICTVASKNEKRSMNVGWMDE